MVALVHCEASCKSRASTPHKCTGTSFARPSLEKMNRAPQAQQGFSILEILVAFVVMAMVVGTILQLFGTSMRNVALADEYSFAVQVAESRMQAVGSEIPVEQGSVTGSEDGTPYNWAVNMEPVELDEKQEEFSLSIQPYQVNVIVSWDSAGKKREYVLSSLRFGEQI